MPRKPLGWQREPARHALAAKGVKTTSNIDELMAGWDGAKRADRFLKTSLKPAKERGALIPHELETDELLTLELDDRSGKGVFYARFILRNEKTGEEIELGDSEMVDLCDEMWGYDATKNTEASHEEAIKASRFLQNKTGSSFHNFVKPAIELEPDRWNEWRTLQRTISARKYADKCDELGGRPHTLWDAMQFKPPHYCTITMEQARELM
jgi:hypothetical protein